MCIAVSETKRGMFEAQSDIMEIRDSMNDEVSNALDEIWQKIKDLAIELCPKESGGLASSVELESEGGSGKISGTATQGGEFYHNSIFAGNDSTFNFSGQPTSQYAQSVHDGHLMANGEFWEGTPFLEDAVDAYESELDAAVNNALNSLDIGDANVPSTNKLGDESD